MQEIRVKVAVRIRPLLPKEILHNHKVCVRVVPNTAQVVLGHDRAFTFDFAFGPRAQQEEIYNSCIKPLVSSLMEGYNVTVFAYGQTGSGKTYTIGGGHIVSATGEECGIIPRAVQDIFQHIGEKHNSDFTVKASYIEVHKEELRDLLEFESSSKGMQIREDEKGNTVLVGARETSVVSADELMSVLQAGNVVRHTGSTHMNEHSSRSHAIFTITLTQREPHTDHTVSSKFHLVDLAGSERVARTGNTGQRLQESAQINSGLLALGNVIRALGDPRRRGQHVPYRDAKITRLLKDSLGGNAQTLVVTCISPSSLSLHETLSSVKFANRALAIYNQPVVNRDLELVRMGELEIEVQTLRDALRDRGSGPDAEPSKAKALAEQLTKHQQELLKFRKLNQDAAQFLVELQDSALNAALSSNQTQLLQEWLDAHRELLEQKSATHCTSWESTSEEPYHITILQLRRELKKCQDALAMDAQIFSQKESQLKQMQDQICHLEQEGQAFQSVLAEERNKSRLQNEKLEEQQLLIDRLRTDLITYRMCSSEASVEPRTSGSITQRPYSVPLPYHLQRDSHISDKAGYSNRKVHTSPPAYSLERVVAAFRTRSQLLLAQIEEKDEVLAPDVDSGDEEKEDQEENKQHSKGFRRSMNHTWTRRLGQGASSKNGVERPLPVQWSSLYEDRPKPLTGAESSLFNAFNIGGGLVVDTTHCPVDEYNYGSALTAGMEKTEENTLRKSNTSNIQRLKEAELRYAHAQQRIRELSLNIRLKEELIKELVKTGKDAEAVNRHYAVKISQLEQEVEVGRSELREINQVQESSQSASNNEQCEAQALVVLTSQSECSRTEVEHSVELLRQQREELKQQLGKEAERRKNLQANITRDQQRIMDLQLKVEKQRGALKSKMEETTGYKNGQCNNSTSVDAEEQTLQEWQQWLGQAEEKVLQQRQALSDLQEELRHREEMVCRREAVSQERSHLEMKKLRSSQAVSRDLLRVSARLAAVNRELEVKSEQLQGSSVDIQAALGKELDSLQQERALLCRRRDNLDLKLRDGNILTFEEEHVLFQLEEGLEVLDAAIEYKNQTINSTQKLVKESSQVANSTEGDILKKLSMLSYSELKMLLLKYFNKVVNLREAERKLQLCCEELQLQAKEQEGVVRELEAALQRLALDSDRRLTEQQREHQRSIQLLLQQFREDQNGCSGDSAKSNEAKIQQLEKDLFFYKMTSRELKKKLREMVADNMTQPCSPGRGRQPKQAANSVHGAPKEGDDGVAHHVRVHAQSEGEDAEQEHGGTQTELVPVRLSRREVCQISHAAFFGRHSGPKASSASFQEDSIELCAKPD